MDSKCLALIPYVPGVKRKSRLCVLYSNRRFIYFLLLPILLGFAFAGAYYFSLSYSGVITIPFAELALDTSAFGPRSVVLIFFAIVFSYTIFSPAGAVLILSPFSFGVGYVLMNAFAAFGFTLSFYAVTLEQSAFAFITFIFAGEIAGRVSVTRMGYKYYCAARYTLPLAAKTIVFVAAFVCNSFYLDNFDFLRG